MRDQAERLRQLVRQEESLPPEDKRRIRVIAVTSGKGGVGKTNIAVNLGLALQEMGAEVLLMDADLGLANVDILLGILPLYSVKDALMGKVGLNDIICAGPGGIQIIPGGSGLQELIDLPEERLEEFISSLEELQERFDYLLIDTGAGISRSVTSFIYAADQILLVTTPEPTAITDAYALVKTILHQLPEANLGLVVNRAASLGEAQETYRKLNMAVHSFLGGEMPFIGWVADDPIMQRAVRSQKPLLLLAPDSSLGRHFRHLARTLHQRLRVTDLGSESERVPLGSSPGEGFFAKLRGFFLGK